VLEHVAQDRQHGRNAAASGETGMHAIGFTLADMKAPRGRHGLEHGTDFERVFGKLGKLPAGLDPDTDFKRKAADR